MKKIINTFMNMSIMAIMLLSMVSATYVTEGATQEVVSGQAVPVYVGTAVQATEVDPAIAPNTPFSGTLREGQTTYHYWNGEKYELTLVWVSDAQYWEDNKDYEKTAAADIAPALDNRPSAKFSINGELTSALHPGEKDATKCGTIVVKEIGNSVTASADQGSASYTFYHKSCTSTPPPNGYVKLEEGKIHSLYLNGQRYRVMLENAEPDYAVFSVYASEYKGQEVKIRVGQYGDAEGLKFHLKDASYDWALIGGFQATSEPPQNYFKDSLKEGETETYVWNNQEYELTLIFVSDPMYWEDSNSFVSDETAERISNRPTAKFMLNGEVTESIPVGGSDKTDCGKIQVDRIDSTGREGAASFVLWPTRCGNTVPPTPSNYLQLREGECKAITLDNQNTEQLSREYEICVKEIGDINYLTDSATTDNIERPEIMPGPSRQWARISVNGQAATVQEYTQTQVGNLHFAVSDIDEYVRMKYFTYAPQQLHGCTEEAKMCPDGSSVARNPNRNCAFDPCPNTYDDAREKCEASGGQWECRVYAGNSNDPYENADAVYQGQDNCRCYYPPTPQPYTGAEECQAMGGQWSCSGSSDGEVQNCNCYLTNIPYPVPYDPSPCYEGCADGEDCGCDQVLWDEEVTCPSGCYKDGRCLPYGTRLANGEAVYCGIEDGFQAQLADGASCQNNYECVSNQCLNAECKSLDKELKNTQNLIQKLFDWFGGIFN